MTCFLLCLNWYFSSQIGNKVSLRVKACIGFCVFFDSTGLFGSKFVKRVFYTIGCLERNMDLELDVPIDVTFNTNGSSTAVLMMLLTYCL